MRTKLIASIVLMGITCSGFAEQLVLSKNNLGPLKLSQEREITFKEIESTFPDYIVTHQIASGDSPDFHLITVKDKNKNTLFYTVSYFDETVNEHSASYKIDLLKILSKEISDSYGVRVGDKVSTIIKKRGSNLKMSANHFDNSIGNEQIFYQVQVEPRGKFKEIGIDYADPTSVTLSQIIESNPEVKSISWPTPSWD